ncbi:tail fiber assembly protein [Vagococcus sp. WN89Y]|uniref:tail fiber assembly protein n=1 Tax=Vagococcus sp. WN89Y TaxID=3457258 RepID=UPI003FCE2EF3
MQLTTLSRYFPEDIPYGNNVQYFIDADGLDFYSSFTAFTQKYKLCVNPHSGVICAIAEDISMLYPEGFSIVETDTLPTGCDISGCWQFIEGEISAVPVDYSSQAEQKKRALQDAATAIIAPLERAAKLNMATAQETQQLEAWERYSVLLNRVDMSDAVNISWPALPDFAG